MREKPRARAVERELRDQIVRLEASDKLTREAYAKFETALEELMRAVLLEVCGPYSHPTSIACARLIAAVETASRTVHDRAGGSVS